MAVMPAFEPEGAGGEPRAGGAEIGVLALQGGFQSHARVLSGLGAVVREVRIPADLAGVQGLVIPGGESTTMTLGLAREGLAAPLRALVDAGLPVLGSCAGLIMLDREHLGLMDIRARRNAFGRQIKSFEADIDLEGLNGGPVRGIFIRAPWIAEHGPSVQILAQVDGHAVAARQGRMLAVAFHIELADDDRMHRMFLDSATDYASVARSSAGQP
jgi:pyridoxal 5'-phosphate synthase pdxT subunit